MHKHVISKMGAVEKLAQELKICQMLETGALKTGSLALSEKQLSPFWKAAQALRMRIEQARLQEDTAFLRRLLDATTLNKKKTYVFSSLTVVGACVLAYGSLRYELRCPPNREQLRKRAEQYYEVKFDKPPKEAFHESQWNRALKILAVLPFSRTEKRQ
jgi:hypothetical protein